MRKALASGAVAFMLMTGGATAASAQTNPNPNTTATTEKKDDNSGKWGLLGLLGLAGLAGLARKKPDTRTVDTRGASVGSTR